MLVKSTKKIKNNSKLTISKNNNYKKKFYKEIYVYKINTH